MKVDIIKTATRKGKAKIFKYTITADNETVDKIVNEINNAVNKFDVVGVFNNLIDKMSRPIFVNLKGENYGKRE